MAGSVIHRQRISTGERFFSKPKAASGWFVVIAASRSSCMAELPGNEAVRVRTMSFVQYLTPPASREKTRAICSYG